MKKFTFMVSIIMMLSACSSGGNQSDNDFSPSESRDSSRFESAVSRTCTRLGLAFSQTDVNFLLQELAGAISQTGYSNSEAIDELNAQCPNKVAYANALP
jgi:hypothetical protein